ncbi:hypothetical protein GQ457_10G027460 [Hibiscus cannabinus]
MEPQNFGHEHPLLFNEEESNPSEAGHCSRCGEVMSGPSFSCAEPECEFYLHKECAEAPSEIDHPFHRRHPLNLLSNPPADYEGSFICNFCAERGEMFFYQCSCTIDLHIKCALFTYKFAQNNFGDLQAIAYKDPSIPTGNGNKELESCKCFACFDPLFDSAYCSLDGGFNLHKKCVELSSEINYPHHYKHPFSLQFSLRKLPCIICYDIKRDGLSYTCLRCDLAIHIACLSPPPSIIQGKGHQHQFTHFYRLMELTCDACGVKGKFVPYMCSSCNLLVHKKCISLPPIIKFCLHEHPLFHCYSITRDNSKSLDWDCVICLDEVNTMHGSYYCSECQFIVHVNCATTSEEDYSIIESVEKFNENRILPEDSYIVDGRNEGGEVTMIKHFTHEHNLVLCDKILDDYECCDGCALPILDSFYHCSECNFFLHRKCSEFPKKKYYWFHSCDVPFILVADNIFKCTFCCRVSNGFSYECHNGCEIHMCLQCATPLTVTCEGHEHPLSMLLKYARTCNGCGVEARGTFLSKKRRLFALCLNCVKLPCKVKHKCDDHLLALTYREDNTYSESHFCDACEEVRNPSYWFYHCAICDTSASPSCILGRGTYPLIKCGKIFKQGEHPHPLRFVKKMHYYPACSHCDAPCRYLALECMEPGCDYIVHWECVCPSDLREV